MPIIRTAAPPARTSQTEGHGSKPFLRWSEVEQALRNGPMPVSQLAEGFAMSPRGLSRRVRDATGQGPSALIQAVRLARARRLLETTRMSIDQVAAAVGYDDATALRRLMRRRTGATPTRFRAHAEPR